ncbi:fumarylacetoacetate hydrolase family protein [Variovorax sp. PCZ-1]|uniref:fumarylacetoacetate hydrolase family protein n=1 Tax=Variovorax sp. PCZ-1 TaxID=2835533 RepID=UPI001BCDF8E6|nr:fumarylacetoacetate hydrolase family protein [Variovorax sp. PCZ-1]MBS7808828.1 fumarylacetoacetate hydrolase family protein [Variovorax sp. PCZ-1]
MMLATVYGSLMHHSAELQALGDASYEAPYNAPPHAPVLYIKPANTFNPFGQALRLSAAHAPIHARACIGLNYRPNQPVAGVETAQDAIKNIVIEDWRIALFCDFSLPHSSFYRPPLRFNALDGSLGLPQASASWSENDLKDQRIETWVNGVCAHRYQTSDWTCSALEQLQRVGEFIAWEAGDVLMLGCPPDAPLVKAGDVVEARMNGQVLTRTVILQEAA